MLLLICIALAALLLHLVLSTVLAFRRNIALANQVGLPYVVVPISMSNPLWKLSHATWFPLLSLLPSAWTDSWIAFVKNPSRDDFWWEQRFKLFDRLGDNFLLVSPGEFRLYTASAEVIAQICSRRADFPKPTYEYEMLSIFGPNVVSTEGSEWRRRRKITSPSFTEKNNSLDFQESLHQIQSMLDMRGSIQRNSPQSIRLDNLPTDTMRMALHVISKAGFGIELTWPDGAGSDGQPDSQKARINIPEVLSGYSLSFFDSSNIFLRNIVTVAILGKRLLKYARYVPFKPFRETSIAVTDWERYMTEKFEQKKRENLSSEKEAEPRMDVMGNLMRGAGIELGLGSSKPAQLLTNNEIISNAFIILMAGHETTANSLTFTSILLAMNRHTQAKVQQEIGVIFQDRPTQEWNYETDVPLLQKSMLAAVINEQLRLYQPFSMIPKMVATDGPRALMIEGQQINIPAKTRIGLSAVGVHRNPKSWPHSASKIAPGRVNDLEDFIPERWMHAANSVLVSESDDEFLDFSVNDDENLIGRQSMDATQKYFQPARGAFIPFSEGQRACIGRRFALVELYAIFSYMISKYTIELDLQEWATDDEVMMMNTEQKAVIYQKAIDRARWILDNTLKTGVTLQLTTGHTIPLRLAERGMERFVL